jgi:hypothetical protein
METVMTSWSRIGRIAAGAFAAALIYSPASAEILAAATRAANFFSSSTTDVVLQLKQNNAKVLRFTTTGPGKTLVKITFNSECMVAAARGTWLALRIEVDGVPADPYSGGTDFAFCTAIDATGNTWMSVSRQSLIKVPAGDHVVRVFARIAFGSGDWQLGDTSLVVEK